MHAAPGPQRDQVRPEHPLGYLPVFLPPNASNAHGVGGAAPETGEHMPRPNLTTPLDIVIVTTPESRAWGELVATIRTANTFAGGWETREYTGATGKPTARYLQRESPTVVFRIVWNRTVFVIHPPDLYTTPTTTAEWVEFMTEMTLRAASQAEARVNDT